MDNSTHNLKKSFPDFFGTDSFVNVKKKWFYKSDLIPIVCVVVGFISLAWVSGHVKPVQRIQQMKQTIEKTNNYFDDRVSKTLSITNVIEEQAEKYNLAELLFRGEDGQLYKTAERVEQLRKAVETLTTEKPTEEVIKKRLDAAIEFANISQEIIDNRNLREYDLNFENWELDQEQKEDQGSDEIPGAIGLADRILKGLDERGIVKGSETEELIKQGQLTIERAEAFLDPLNESEEKAKQLIADFNGLVIPRREHEFLKHMQSQWREKYFALLDIWKQTRTMEMLINERVDGIIKAAAIKQAKIDKAEADKAAKAEGSNTPVAEEVKPVAKPKPVVKPKPKPVVKPVQRTKPVSRPKPPQKTPQQIREEKRQRALDLLK